MKKNKWFIGIVSMVCLTILSIVINQNVNADPKPLTPELKSIKNKMENAIDYYKHAKGSYIQTSSDGSVRKIEFEVNETEQAGSKVKIYNTDNQLLRTTISNHRQILIQDDVRKTYHISPVSEPAHQTPGIRKQMREGAPVYIYRPDPAAPGDSGTVSFPQALAFWMDEESRNFSITGSTKILGREGIIIEGVSPFKNKAEKYKMIVDEQTGILLHFEAFDSKGNIALAVEVTELEIDAQSALTQSFKLTAPEGYVDVTVHEKLIK
ncbi:hypothetical protein [Marinicrinis sediminis]|uniref:Outer membrane lipoprotein carrier protein LolA n=1 Tax=Marinicrinis sediminis TaxID=1652465 RepID=A0ABW5RF73_9BACL